MNVSRMMLLLAFSSSLCWAQMPSSFDASGQSAKADSGVQEQSGSGEPANPQLLGMEIPLMDPSTDTVKYNGAYFDVGNNAAVRARFEKYLSQKPDESAESKMYRSKINEILKLTQKYIRGKRPGSKVLVSIGRTLYDINEYPGDGGQAGALASAIVSALDAQRANFARDRESEQMEKEIDELVKRTNSLNNRNTQRGGGAVTGNIKPGAQGGNSNYRSNDVLIAHNTAKVAETKAARIKNEAENAANLLAAKTTYQSMMASFLLQRRFDHALIAARLYRHVFRDGDTKLNINKDSDLGKMFDGVGGLPPTVSMLDQLASNARREIDQNMESVHSLLAQNKLSTATQRLIEAVAIGEYMQSVATFPEADRRRIFEFWELRKKALTSLNHRDYGQLQEVADKMKAMDADFDDSLLRTYCKGKMNESNLHLRNAKKAIAAGDEETFNSEVRLAAEIWPLNPNIDKGMEQIEELDSQDYLKDDFRDLMARGDLRGIYDQRDKFKVVAIDQELGSQYEEAVRFVAGIDELLSQIGVMADASDEFGSCMAYEMLDEYGKKDKRYLDDEKFKDAVNLYRSRAHRFVDALSEAQKMEKRNEYGSSLSAFYHARCQYPNSRLAQEGIERLSELILRGRYDGASN